MKILLYHENRSLAAQSGILDRAAHRAHLLRRTYLWDILLLFLLVLSAVWLRRSAPFLAQFPMLRAVVPVRDSAWEQFKLLFFPAAVLALLRWLTTGDLQKGILTTYAAGLLRSGGMLLCIWFTLRGILGFPVFWADSGAVLLAGIDLTRYIAKAASRQKHSNLPGMIILLLMEMALIFCTDHAPEIGLFAE